jgi:hypothetical protein
MPQSTPPFINVGTSWQNLNLNAELTALGIEQGDQLMITNRSTFTLFIHCGTSEPTTASGYDRVKKGETFITVADADTFVRGAVGQCSLLVEYAP